MISEETDRVLTALRGACPAAHMRHGILPLEFPDDQTEHQEHHSDDTHPDDETE